MNAPIELSPSTDPAALLAELQPEIDAVDLEVDIDPATQAAIAFSELSGTRVADFSKRLMVLQARGRFSVDSLESLFLHIHTDNHTHGQTG